MLRLCGMIFLKKVIKYFDERSYTLYLCHGIIFCGIIDKFSMHILAKFIIAVIGTVVLTLIVHKYYEKPIQNILLTKLTK